MAGKVVGYGKMAMEAHAPGSGEMGCLFIDYWTKQL